MGGAFAKLVQEDQVGAVTVAIERTIEESFVTHPVRHLTRAEITRRFDMCARIFAKLRGELQWGLARIFARLPEYLRAELNGSDWSPDARTIWTPQDGK